MPAVMFGVSVETLVTEVIVLGIRRCEYSLDPDRIINFGNSSGTALTRFFISTVLMKEKPARSYSFSFYGFGLGFAILAVKKLYAIKCFSVAITSSGMGMYCTVQLVFDVACAIDFRFDEHECQLNLG